MQDNHITIHKGERRDIEQKRAESYAYSIIFIVSGIILILLAKYISKGKAYEALNDEDGEKDSFDFFYLVGHFLAIIGIIKASYQFLFLYFLKG